MLIHRNHRMKMLATLFLVLATAAWAAEPVKLWTGKARGMELVTIGHKQVTVLLADGRTAVLGIPILVEKTNPYSARLKELQRKQQQLSTRPPADPRLDEVSETLRSLEMKLPSAP